MKRLIIITILLWVTGQMSAQPGWKLTPYMQQTGMLLSSDRITSSGYGSGLGVALSKGHFLAQTDVNLLWTNGNAASNRFAVGIKGKGVWSPALLGTFATNWGDRTEILSETGQRPPSAVWVAGVRIAPLRFEKEKGYLSALEFGYGVGRDNARSLEISLVTIGINF